MAVKSVSRAVEGIGASIHSINQFALQAGDTDEMARFLDAFGLRVQQGEKGLLVRGRGDEHVWAQILPGPGKKLLFMSFGCFAGDYSTIRAQVEAAGARFIDPPEGGDGDGFWFADPDGIALQVKVAPNLSPPEKRPVASLEVPAGEQGAAMRSLAPKVGPLRLAHLALFVSDIDRSLDFYMRTLGLYLADRSANVIAFTYAPHGCDHHLVAMVEAPGGGLHHCSWEVPNLEHAGLIGQQARDAGYGNQWGLGRHVLGSNWFNYIEAPGGGWWEATFNIDYIPKGMPWPAQDHAVEDSFYLWGPDLPANFVTYSEAT